MITKRSNSIPERIHHVTEFVDLNACVLTALQQKAFKLQQCNFS